MENLQKPEAQQAPDLGQLKAEEVVINILEVNAKGVRFKLWPDVEAVRAKLELLRPRLQKPYSARHYVCGHAMYCAIALDDATRDAPCPAGYRVNNDAAVNEADGSFVAAAASWGIGTAVFNFPSMSIDQNGVHINHVEGRDGKTIHHYELADTLTMSGIQYGEDGSVTGIKLVRQDGKVIVWQPKN